MKEFKTKAELFAYLVENKAELINLKKSVVKHSDVVSSVIEDAEPVITKGKYPYENNEEAGSLKRTIIANTYNWLDSHADVHLNGVFAESIKQKGTKIFHLNSHQMDFSAKIGKPLAIYEKEISWRELGQGKTGMTQALFLESEIKRDYSETMYKAYLNDEVDQHSVGMQYVKIALAVNDEENYPKEFEEWQKHIGKIGNRSLAEQKGYFFAVYEAKLVEVSAVMLGSNELTPTLGGNKTNPLEAVELKVIDSVPAVEQSEEVVKALNSLSKSLALMDALKNLETVIKN
jgi:hypothetical protein